MHAFLIVLAIGLVISVIIIYFRNKDSYALIPTLSNFDIIKEQQIEVTEHINAMYEQSFEFNGKLYIFKHLMIPVDGELVINSKYYWQLNKKMRTGKQPRSKEMIESIKPYIDYQKDNIVKYVIISDCYNFMRVINENEMEIVKESTEAFGMIIVRQSALDKILKKVIANQ
ncbi:MAG: hypothetical protein FWE36_07430 [Erysipelotrichales bacterium]|nr:hypothetical protein [Erysipelotrichales bacterium]